MKILEMTLTVAVLLVWLCLGVTFLIASVMAIINDHKREEREKAQAARDLEYHNKRMETLIR